MSNDTEKKKTEQEPKRPNREQAGLSPEPHTREEQEKRIDEAMEDSFPASDPPSYTVTTKDSTTKASD